MICFTRSKAGRTSKLKFFLSNEATNVLGLTKFNWSEISVLVALSAVAVNAKIGVEGKRFFK